MRFEERGFGWRKELLAIFLIKAMFAASVVSWPWVPERVPIHWGLSGEPDAYGSKPMGLFLVPVVALLVYVSMLTRPYTDPRRVNRGRFPVSFPVLRAAAVALLAAIHAFALVWILGA